MKKQLSILVILALVVCAGAFYGGMKYGQSKFVNSLNAQRQQRMGQFGGAGARPGVGQRNGDGLVNGEILSKDDSSITVKLRDNGSKIIFYSDSTEISKFAKGTKDDLKVGDNIMVNGKSNTDGTLTAQIIQLRPEIPNMPVKPAQ